MGSHEVDLLTGHRPRWRSYLLLARVSNLPTVWTNVLAGMAAAGPLPEWTTFARVTAAVSLFYTGGMFLNDAFDEHFDRATRPERPLPAGDVTRIEVLSLGMIQLLLGELLLWPSRAALGAGILLACAIVYYDYRHKQSRVAPFVMGACRGLVYVVAAASVGRVSRAALAGAGVMLGYVAGLTVVAKLAGSNARWLVPVLIAGISVVDAAFLVVAASAPALAAVAATGFFLTLFLQRYVPGD